MLDTLVVQLVPLKRLFPHEEVDGSKIEPIMHLIEEKGIHIPLLAAKDHDVLLDGYHRLEALQRLGARRAPVVYVDYMDDTIILDGWRDQQLTKEEVLAHAEAGKLYPIKTTKHLCMHKGRQVHLAKILPRVDMSLEELRKES